MEIAAGGASGTPTTKRPRLELFRASAGSNGITQRRVKSKEEIQRDFEEATAAHPFVDRIDYDALVQSNAVFHDKNGKVCGILVRDGLPQRVAEMAANVLRPAATRTSLRASVFGGESPLSGIAGYYDYNGSPIEFKCRKTSFTCEVLQTWKDVFPMVECVSELYKLCCPDSWAAQNAAIPDVVRIRNSPFSTLTINQRFRTARHTDAGDFDEGFGILTVLEGDFDGLHLGFPEFRVAFQLRPRDVLLFDTHHYHCNTELERLVSSAGGGSNCNVDDWNRLTCVLYYRAALGESNCMNNYRRRLAAAKAQVPRAPQLKFDSVPDTENGTNLNRPAAVFKEPLTPFLVAASCLELMQHRPLLLTLHEITLASARSATNSNDVLRTLEEILFGEKVVLSCDSSVSSGLPMRPESDKLAFEDKANVIFSSLRAFVGPKLGGFSEGVNLESEADRRKDYFTDATLREALNAELFAMWKTARDNWLTSVSDDWKKMVKRNPEREDFLWNNGGLVNSGFFDLCDVGRAVMLQLLGKDEATSQEENFFWLGFARHLFDMCQSVNKMPETAMSMRKLNVKLKDYKFGGTRYFKDQTPEEQARRLKRKAAIEAARRGRSATKGRRRRAKKDGDGSETDSDDSDGDDGENMTNDWLANDSFDYQSEDSAVPYAHLGLPLPADNAKAAWPYFSDPTWKLRVKPLSDASITVLVVVPSVADIEASRRQLPAWPGQAGLSPLEQQQVAYLAHAAADNKRSLDTFMGADSVTKHGGVTERVVAAYQAISSVATQASSLTADEVVLNSCGVRVRTLRVTTEELLTLSSRPETRVDVVVLRHALDASNMEQASALLKAAKQHAAVVVAVETEAHDRSRFLLRVDVNQAFDAVAAPLWNVLHWARNPGSARPRLAYFSAALMNDAASAAGARVHGIFNVPRSPLNTACYVIG